MNYELLYKLAIEENDKLKSEATILRKRNERLHLEIEKVEALIKAIEEEKTTLKNQMDSFKEKKIINIKVMVANTFTKSGIV